MKNGLYWQRALYHITANNGDIPEERMPVNALLLLTLKQGQLVCCLGTFMDVGVR